MAQAQQAGLPNRQQPKNPGKNKFSHTPNTQFGMGDCYGTGIKAKVGTVREDTLNLSPGMPRGLKTPPRSLA